MSSGNPVKAQRPWTSASRVGSEAAYLRLRDHEDYLRRLDEGTGAETPEIRTNEQALRFLNEHFRRNPWWYERRSSSISRVSSVDPYETYARQIHEFYGKYFDGLRRQQE